MTTVKTLSPQTTTGSAAMSLFQHVRVEHLVAGVTGGVASTLILHPLDLIKIRFAVNDGRSPAPQYNGLRNAFSTIFKQEGIRGLYKGVTPNVWGSGSAWGFYFLFYNSIKTWVQGGNSKTPLGPSMHMLLAAQAGVLTLIMTNPVWVVKTRLCLQYSDAKPSSGKSYAGMVDALLSIYRLEGFRGLYRGFVPGIFGVSHGAIQFMTYEEMKNFYNEYRNAPIDTKLGTVEYLGFAASSKLVAASITYPYQVVRARLQDQYHTYEGSLDCIKQTWRYEGLKGFYKGLVPNLTRVVPATMITFVTYENMWRFVADRIRPPSQC